MIHKNNPNLYYQRKRAFVEAAAELIRTQPFKSISIRKIADTAGFHNSTIYSYFQDADWLLALASVRFLQPYSNDLTQIRHLDLTPLGLFYAIWECFCRHAFSQPALFYNFFFGKYKNQLTDLINEYYELFPEQRNEHTLLVSDMFFGNNMYNRCQSLMDPLIGDSSTRITEDTIHLANYIVVSTLEEFLLDHVRIHDDSSDENLSSKKEPYDTETATDKFLKMLHFIIDR